MGLAVFAFLGRQLAPRQLGVLLSAFVLAQVGSTLLDQPVHALQQREGARDPAARLSIDLWARRIRTRAGALMVVGVSLIGLVVVSQPADRLTIAIVALTIPLGGLGTGVVRLQHEGRLGALAAIALFQGGSWLAAVVALGATGASLPVYAATYAVATGAHALLLHVVASRGAPDEHVTSGKLTPWHGRHMLGDGLRLAAVSLASVGYYKLDAVLVLQINGAVASALYGLAYRFLDQAQILPVTIANIFVPGLSASHTDPTAFAAIFQRYLRMSLLAAVPCVGVGMLVAGSVVRVVFNRDLSGAAPLARILLPAFVPVCVGYVVTSAAVAAGQTKRQPMPAIVAVVLCTIANVALLPVYGPRAAAWTTLVTEAVVVSLLYLRIRRHAPVPLPVAWLARLGVVVLVSGGPAVVFIALGATGLIVAPSFVALFLTAAAAARLTTRSELANLRS